MQKQIEVVNPLHQNRSKIAKMWEEGYTSKEIALLCKVSEKVIYRLVPDAQPE